MKGEGKAVQHFLHPSSFILHPLTEALAYLLGAEGSDAVEAEAEDDSVLLPEPDVEGEVLARDGAAVPSVADRDHRAYERRASLARTVLEVEEEGRAAEEAAVSVAQENGRAPLRALQR